MAQLFKEVMEEEEFKDRYRVISFAILSDHNDRSGNLAAFEEVFGKRMMNYQEYHDLLMGLIKKNHES